MEKTGKDLKLGDTLYYVDDSNFRIKEYIIETLELSVGNIEINYGTPIRYGDSPPKNSWNGISVRFGTQWEKRPTILKDGKGGVNRWNDFDIFIYKEDAIECLNKLIDKQIKKYEDKISELKNKKN